ncbi:helix-turn-helix domain-containing protein [Bacillus sp. JJ722]|uniref:helix-turn-helix domain-containing protein n=1 Tax=Bacillus sp. JJ722 TaxID=3122973 RepID=UPI002FFFA60F
MSLNYQYLKERREEKKLTQLEVAEKLGYKSKTSIHYIENGKKQIPGDKLLELANILDIDLRELSKSQ